MAIDGARLLEEHAAGASYRDMAQRHGIGHETARRLVIEHLDDLLLKIIVAFVAALRDHFAGVEADWPAYHIPYGPGRPIALSVQGLITQRLRDRGLPVQVRVTSIPPHVFGGGQVFAWVLDEQENRRREAAKENR